MKIGPAAKWQPRAFENRPEKKVRAIIADVRHYGLGALEAYAKKWDQGIPKTWKVGLSKGQRAWKNLSPADRRALTTAGQQLKMWSKACLPQAAKSLKRQGMILKQTVTPLESVACYVPGGHYPLVSSVLMGLIPALVAGVKRRVLLTPAPQGKIHSTVLAAAHFAEATEIWPVGGAQAIAAAAYGAGAFKPVDKIVGPGNSYVTEAKRQVQDDVAIDMLAGPSELLIIVDSSTPLEPIALDLLAQAEHGPGGEALVMSQSRKVLEKLRQVLRAQALKLYDLDETLRILEQVQGLQAKGRSELTQVANQISSEHLQLAVKNPEPLLKGIHSYGTVFVGAQTPTALGDYISGANHVLPTNQGGRFRGGLNVDDFLVKRTVQEYRPDSRQKLYKEAAHLASLEGLKAHELSLRVRQS